MASEQVATARPRRRFYVKRFLQWTGILLLALLILGIAYQAVAVELNKRAFQPDGQMIDVDGHQMHIFCKGNGSPTIVLEAGAYSFSTEWYWLQGQLEQTHRVCSYNRAGNGWSERVVGLRDGLTLVSELHSLLRVADVEPPYVIVGHSLGGVLAPIYASQYPDETLGLVLVDSAVPRQWTDRAAFDAYLTGFPSPYTIMSLLTRIGATRLILTREFESYGYPASVTAELTAAKATAQGVDTWNAEARDAQWELGQQLFAVGDLGDLPVAVLWAQNPDFKTPEERAVLEQIWDMLPTFSSNTLVQVIDGANHGSIIGNETYAQQVSDIVLRVVEAATSGEPLSR